MTHDDFDGSLSQRADGRGPASGNMVNGALLSPSNNGKLKSLHRLFKGGSSPRRNPPSLITPLGRLMHCDYCI